MKPLEAMARAHWDNLSAEDIKHGLHPPPFDELSLESKEAQCEAVRAALRALRDCAFNAQMQDISNAVSVRDDRAHLYVYLESVWQALINAILEEQP